MATLFFKKTESEEEEKNNMSFDSEESNSSIEISIDEIEETLFNESIYKTIISISKILETLVEKNSKIKRQKIKENSLFKPFFTENIPEISIKDYLNRIIYYTKINENTLIASLIYIDRLCIKNIPINNYSIYRILFSCILLSIKLNEDCIFKNSFYSIISGIPLEDLNLIEYNLLLIFDFQTNINVEIFNKYKNGLLENMIS